VRKSLLALLSCCAVVTLVCPVIAVDEALTQTTTGVQPPQAAAVTVDSDYRLAEEDVLRMDVWGEPQLTNMQMQITPGGMINVPYIGEMKAAGLTQFDLTTNIAKAFVDKQILIDPSIQITLLTMHRPTVRVWGAVQRPGEIYFKEGDKLMDAVAGAGSYISDTAWLEKATLTRKESKQPINIDLKKMVDGDLSQNFELQKGDTIYIPTEDYENKFYVMGQVMRPGIYDLKDNTTVLSAVNLAGGPTERGVLRSTVIVRGDPKNPQRVDCDLTRLLDKADLTQDVILQPGDVVMVPESKKPNWNKISQVLNSLLSLSYLRRYGLF